ncbi:MAG: ribosomal biogenesis protein [Euryarchaeota archaeon]|nr:ribosomal biogenesis protein [Euryarchaeota archaeon]
MILVTKWFGVFLVDREKIVKKVLFEKDAIAIAAKLAKIQRGELLPEEESLAVKRMKVAEPRLSSLGKPEFLNSSFIRAEDYGYSHQLRQSAMVELGKIRSREPLPADRFILQAVRGMDDLIEMINLMSERLHEWYGLHFPELVDYAHDARYADLIAQIGSREEILDALDLQLESVGSELEDKDLKVVRSYASSLASLYGEKKHLESYISERMNDVAPNLSAIIGPSLGARLISLAGGLRRLAVLPSGTVQLLGAEKAMFAHLRKGRNPPKHGIIFQHPLIHRAPYWQRGNVARVLSGKLSIAARVDYYKGEFIGDSLNDEIARRIKDIQDKYPEPPPKKPYRPRTQKGKRQHRGRGRR